MITRKTGDLLSVTEGFIVHGCNARGIMGSGVALQIRRKYPEAFRGYYEYVKRIENYNARLGGANGIKLGGKVINHFVDKNLVIVNAITQDSFGRNPDVRYVDYDAVRECFKTINGMVQARRNNDEYSKVKKVINFPLIGCGLANGDWEVVKGIIDEEIDDSIEKVLWIWEG